MLLGGEGWSEGLEIRFGLASGALWSFAVVSTSAARISGLPVAGRPPGTVSRERVGTAADYFRVPGHPPGKSWLIT